MCRQYYKENKEEILKMAQDQCNALFEEKKQREYGKRRCWKYVSVVDNAHLSILKNF